MFMNGAYQDVMGDMHNLFGRVNEVHVYVDDDDPEDFYLGEIIRGDHVDKVLQSLLYEPADLVRRVKTALDAADEGRHASGPRKASGWPSSTRA